jgi:broad specificity phosphatase PhoE
VKLSPAQNIVLGQGDSPLTDNGLILAQMASESPYINGRMTNNDDRSIRPYYWRTYCSDLHRAHRTARIVLGLEDIHGTEIEQLASDDNNGDNSNRRNINLIVEPRLRELAKGAREGYPKSLSYEEAVARRIQEADNGSSSSDNVEIPLLESIDDAWERAKDWIDSLVNDASIEYNAENKSSIDESCNDANNNDGKTTEKVYNVFGLSHSALIRTMIHKMSFIADTKLV